MLIELMQLLGCHLKFQLKPSLIHVEHRSVTLSGSRHGVSLLLLILQCSADVDQG
jgi:hypothetical protein